MEISLARALKEKKRIAGRLAHVQSLIQANNVFYNDYPSKLDVRELLKEEDVLRTNLVTIKSEIAHANGGISHLLVSLAEYKAALTFWREVNTDASPEVQYAGRFVATTEVKYRARTAIIDEKECLEYIRTLERKIADVQDAIDDYNAMTKLSINFAL